MKMLLNSIAAIAITASFAAAQDVTIASGKAGGGYAKADKILSERLSQRGVTAAITHNNGSDAITLALCSGAADIGRTQIDAIYARALEGCRLDVAGLHGSEYAVMMVPPKSKIKELDDLNETSKVLVDSTGSGSELFWRTIVSIEMGDDGDKDAWAKARPVIDEVSAANSLAAFGDVDAVIMVRKLDSMDITSLVGLGWTIGYLYDRDINDLQFNDRSLYEAEKITIGGKKNWAYVVPSFVVVKSGNDELKSKVRSAM